MLTDEQVDILFHEHGIATLDARRKVARAIEFTTRAQVIEECAKLFDDSPNTEMFRQQIAEDIRALSTVPGEKL